MSITVGMGRGAQAGILIKNAESLERFEKVNVLVIDKTGGAGSHYKVTWPHTQKSVTLQAELRKDVLYYILKEIEQYSGVTWEDIKKEL